MRRRFGVLGGWALGVAVCGVIAPIGLAVGAAASDSNQLMGRQVDAAAAQGLIARLAVLRRAQTAADVLPSPLHLNRFPYSGVIIPSLTRLVASPPNARLFLVVTTPAGGPRPFWSAKLGDQVAIVAVTAGGAAESVGIPAADLSNADELESPALPDSGAFPPVGANQVGIVPDGVARVSWTFANPRFRPGRVVNLPAADNVAVVALDRSTAQLLSARWYAADGTRVPTSDGALRRARAAQDAAMRRQIIRQDARTSARPSPVILSAFAVFAIHSRRGVRIPGGMVISKPSLATVPLPILRITSGRQRAQLDPEDMRQVRTRSGFRLWVIPGRRGLCVAIVDPPRRGFLGQGAGQTCSGSIRSATTFGAGLSSGYPGGRTVTVSVLPTAHPTITVRSRHGQRRTIRPPYGIYVARTGA